MRKLIAGEEQVRRKSPAHRFNEIVFFPKIKIPIPAWPGGDEQRDPLLLVSPFPKV